MGLGRKSQSKSVRKSAVAKKPLSSSSATTSATNKCFTQEFLDNFWDDSNRYTCNPLADDIILKAEIELGYKLPRSYIELMKNKNGGDPKRTTYLLTQDMRLDLEHICGIGWEDIGSICGACGFNICKEDRDIFYPNIGVYFGWEPSGHSTFCLDYRKGSRNPITGLIEGEPTVVLVADDGGISDDGRPEEEPLFVADNFEQFVKHLVADAPEGGDSSSGGYLCVIH
jgi:hypothetical protein